jgi:hypothetical protein
MRTALLPPIDRHEKPVIPPRKMLLTITVPAMQFIDAAAWLAERKS